ncbi:SMP-30/gluconolactonase/LRE family protein [Amycolatopsis pithecellobii]|uniref:SMP-30/gluconolactonase/LRE family protein n=1 Tax=Amycolatopsis pithecellobii TaxID=664692 RepID=A0A6N7Z9W5_9PSEU|nr:SMP-30/gluconolactonase/LRE family protein [Amycolatopsis pithecellobii]MTD58523.1 SMP-30/gluconolactonase/LRE family protein [Amycolatopsis pithecellobii]
MKEYIAEQATTSTYSLAEGPLWDHRTQELFWVDIHQGDVHRGTLDGSRIVPVERCHVDVTVGAVALGHGGLLVAGHQQVLELSADGTVGRVARLVPEGQQRRLNDGKTDPAGRFLVGTLNLGADGPETLYQVRAPGDAVVVDDDLGMSNGLGFSPDGTLMYSVDTGKQVVWRRPYDAGPGTWGRREVFAQIPDGSPDGLCVDAAGGVWLAVWGTGQVRGFGPDGRQYAVVHVDAPYVSCPTFAGPRLDTLVITTAIDDLDEHRRAQHPHSGALFTAHVDAIGLPAIPFTPTGES